MTKRMKPAKVLRDAVTGQPLEKALVRAARTLELDYFK